MTTKGVWYPDKSKATDKDPPLYLHVSGSTQAMVDAAVALVNDRIAQDLGSLVEDRRRDDKPRERVSNPSVSRILIRSLVTHNMLQIQQRKWPEEKLPVGLETIRNFNVRAKVVGPQVIYYSRRHPKVFEGLIFRTARVHLSNIYKVKRTPAYRSRASALASTKRKQVGSPRSLCTFTSRQISAGHCFDDVSSP